MEETIIIFIDEGRDNKNSYKLLLECKLMRLLCKSVWWYLLKLSLSISYEAVIPFLDMYLTEMDIFTKSPK